MKQSALFLIKRRRLTSRNIFLLRHRVSLHKLTQGSVREFKHDLIMTLAQALGHCTPRTSVLYLHQTWPQSPRMLCVCFSTEIAHLITEYSCQRYVFAISTQQGV